MASLTKKKNSIYWIACFRAANGKQVRRSTKIKIEGRTEKQKAQIVATKFEMASKGELGVDAHFRRTLEDLNALAGGESSETFGSWSAAWLVQSESRVNKSYLYAAKSIIKNIEIDGSQLLESIRPEQVQAYLDLRLKTRSKATVRKDRNILSKCFADAVRLGLIAKNPVSPTPSVKVDDATSREPFTDKELKAILKACPSEWKRLVTVACLTGLRISDCASLSSDHFDEKRQAIRITESKTNKPLVIPVNRKVASYLKRGLLVPELSTQSTSYLGQEFDDIMTAAKIDRMPRKVAKNTTYAKSFHSLRHTFVSKLANSGVDPELRQKLVGHSSTEVHDIYTHHNFDRLRDAVEKVSL